MFRIGCHLSSSKGFLAMAKQAEEIGANTFQFFTRNPRGGKAKDLDVKDIAAYQQYAAEHGIGQILAHAPYTINACGKDERVQEFARETMADDLRRLEEIPDCKYNFHPGSHVQQGAEVGIEKIAGVLNEIMWQEQKTTVLLETMAGKGTEVGRNFEELQEILSRVKYPEKVGVCLDTCHVSDAGYALAEDLDGVLMEFDRVIGLERLHAVHLNNSLNPCGSHKDRHAKLLDGCIPPEALVRVTRHPALAELPFILETPNDDAGYAQEIAWLRAAQK
mgnify:CR=1 FL=1